MEQVERWRAVPSVWSPSSKSRHAEILGKLLKDVGEDSNGGVPGAHVAALAIEHDLRLCTGDGGFLGSQVCDGRIRSEPES
jgi:hypothetical protein